MESIKFGYDKRNDHKALFYLTASIMKKHTNRKPFVKCSFFGHVSEILEQL